MNKLVIYDASAFVYAGMNSSSFKDKTYYNYTIGGVVKLLSFLSADLNTGKDIMICFEGRSKRKDMIPGYKNGRPKNLAVYSQLEFLYEHLTQLGFACYKKAGYEADDLIYNICEQNRDRYSSIDIYSSDYDLCHNVTDTVSFKSITSLVTSVNYRTFTGVLSKDVFVPYNTITASKVFMGDSSDTIKSFTSEAGYTGKKLFVEFADIIMNNCLNCFDSRSRGALEVFLQVKGDTLTEKDVKELKSRMDVFYPFEDDGDYTLATNKNSLIFEDYVRFIIGLGDLDLKRALGVNYQSNTFLKDELMKRAKALSSGEFAADKGISLHEQPIKMQSFSMKGF